MSNRLSELWDLLEDATESPFEIASPQIWNLFDEILETLPVEQHLSIAAKVFSASAVLLDKRSQQLLKDWSDSTNPIGPTVEDDIFSGLVRTSVQLDLDDLIAPPMPQTFKKYGSRPSLKPNDSVVAVVEKEKILKMVEQIETIEEIRALAGDEDVGRWQSAIREALADRQIANFLSVNQLEKIGLTELQKVLSMPMVEVWMGLLLGDYQLSQQGEFYETEGVLIENLVGEKK
jgi:chromatin segregation and condensation protein Rec8/ScpA/Scc1 (kleisin family)